MSDVSKRTPLETFDEFVRAYNAHDRAATHACFSHEFVRYGLTTGWKPMGWDSYKGIFDPYLVAFPDFRFEVISAFASGEWVSSEVWEYGTFEADYAYRPDFVIPHTGESYRCRYAIIARVVDGLIVDYRFYEDASWANQLKIDFKALSEQHMLT
ncbi:ester cyclase [Mycobacterium sp. 94-17]|uniref:ester cyclase n=1 Tax=Mycobacterium sp. 94-17 TaxID=2986147 RepID=UPI002D1EEAAF|nr:nuclear transport factor 2 family protein [Mycobacterium sp. 94-17]MEB4211754.1 nuclear transport factor 2 family protein [Mycobacterium sp. 94-17]